MKRRITVEQLQELTEEQQQRLREWWKPEHGDWYLQYWIDDEPSLLIYDSHTYLDDMFLPLLDIGQMIELLNNYDCDTEMQSAGNMWYVMVGGHINTQAEELCDALWQAVKQIL